MKKNQNRGQQQAGRNRKVNQPRVRARADETVIIQITDEQGREWARVPFSRLEHSALKAVCDLRGCTMKELFDQAVTATLAQPGSPPPPAAPPQPGGTAAASAPPPGDNSKAHLGDGKRLGAVEDAVRMGMAVVHLLGNCLATNRDVQGHGSVGSGFVSAGALLEDQLNSTWQQWCDSRTTDRALPNLCELESSVRMAAAFSHAAAHTCAINFEASLNIPGLSCGYRELGNLLADRLLAVVEPEPRLMVNSPEVAA